MIFPYWNPSSSSPNPYITTASPTCTGVTVLKSGLTCSFSSASNKLTITGILNSNQVGGTAMSFTVIGVNNPYSGVPRTGFTLQTQDSSGGAIDQSTAAVY